MQALIEKVGSLSPQERKALAVLLKQQGVNLFEIAPVFKRQDGEPLRLSYAQERQWFLWQLEPESAAYHIPSVLRLRGRLDLDALQRSFDSLVARHETLRTRFRLDGDEARQEIAASMALPLDIVALGPLEEGALARQVETTIARPFDLERGPLLRVSLLRLAEDDHVLVLVQHHIVSDGWSMQVMVEELVQLYAAYSRGLEVALPALPIQYADYALWQRSWMEAGEKERQLAYWTGLLGGEQPVLELPFDRPRPVRQSHRGAQFILELDIDLSQALRRVAQQEGATAFALLLASFQALLYRYSGQADIRVGVPIANRNRVETERLIGFFVNTQVLKADLDGRMGFDELLAQARQRALEAQAHQDLPFEQLVEALQPERSLSHNPLFQVLFNYQSEARGNGQAFRFDELQMESVQFDSRTAQFDLTLDLTDEEQRFCAVFDYATDLFDASTVERLAGHWRNLLRGIVANPRQRLGELPLLDAPERRQTLSEWNPAQRECAVQGTLQQRFEEQARQRPQAVALILDEHRLSYGELNARANRLAHCLIARGVGADVPVGLALERSLDMLVGLLAILKAGGAYLPLDPAAPEERLAHILDDSGVRLLLTQGHLLERLPRQAGVEVLAIDGLVLDGYAESDPLPTLSADNLAYVIYTSGSTGKPKGTLLTHRNALRLFSATEAWFGFDERDVWTLFHSYAFDFSVWEIFGALLYGGRLVIVPQWVSRSPEDFYRLLCREGVTVLNQTPSAFKQLMAVACSADMATQQPALRYVIFGGEALDLQSLRPWFQRFGDRQPQLVNMYGITETTVHVTYRPVSEADLEGGLVSPIGGTIPDLSWYILDRDLNPVPRGAVGELYIGRAGLARGYLRRPGLSATRFVPNPFPGGAGERLYRTGDLARFQADGNIEYIGRIDHQVKVRGFRIELGEIEAALAGLAGVRDAVVLAHDGVGGTQLVGYVVADSAEDAERLRESLRESLKRHLPDYMVPAHLMLLERMPLTVNGKLDRQALPQPDASLSQQAYRAPGSELEQRIAAIWAEILGVERVGLDDNFFELGGHSLLATRVISRVRQEQQLDASLKALFERPVLEAFAQGLERTTDAVSTIPLADRQQPLALSFAQERQWFLWQLEPESAAYHIPSALRLRGRLDVDALQRSFDSLVARHETLRTRFRLEGGRSYQQVQPAVSVSIEREQFGEEGLIERIQAIVVQPFDLERGPLLRVNLLQLAEDDHVLVLVQHHIVSDGWSMQVMVEELVQLYAGYSQGLDVVLPALPIQYADYALWQRSWMEAGEKERQLAYWTGLLGGEQPVLELPFDRPRPARQSHRGAQLGFELSRELVEAVRALAQREGTSSFMLLLASFQALLYRYSGQADIRVGVPIANRNRVETERLIGFFVNTQVLKADLDGRMGFDELLAQARQRALEAQAHQDLPFEQLVEALQPERNASHNPLFQVLFNHQSEIRSVTPEVQLEDLRLEGLAWDGQTAQFDLTLDIQEDENGIWASFDYAADLFDASTVERLAGHWRNLLRGIVANPRQRLGELPLLDAPERRQTLSEWNPAQREYAVQGTLQQRFEEQARQRPQAVALILDEQRLSYGELNARANRLAHCLIARGVGADVPVGLALERSLDMLVGLLAILKAGGAYLPLDPAAPEERLAHILDDSGVRLLLTQGHLLERLPRQAGVEVLAIDGLVLDGYAESDPLPTLSADNLAYVIYTSGSTGKPKGTLLTHRNALRLFSATEAWFGFDERDVWTLFHSYAFDFSVWEIFGALLYGGCLVIVPQWVSRSPEDFYRLLCREGVTVLNQTPSAFKQLMAVACSADMATQQPALRYVIFGGEALDLQSLRPWFQRFGDRQPQLVNMYGITETTVHVTYRPVSEADLKGGLVSPIGGTIPDLSWYILDRDLNPVPRGAVGELYIGRAGLARGYLRRPGLSATRFVPNPFPGGAGERLYRTGDLARFQADGNIEYIGRIDHQVKVRGFRIELGEIEAALAGLAGVRDAVVLAHDGVGGTQLVGYVVADSAEDAERLRESLRESLKRHLPDYMVPAHLMLLERMPLTVNGKLDRQALPQPDASLSQQAYRAPGSELEQRIAAIWSEILGVERVGLDDNFFELGGHSLLLLMLKERIGDTCQATLSISQLMTHASVAEQAACIEGQARESLLVPLNGRREGSPLFMFHPSFGSVHCYKTLAMALRDRHPVKGVVCRALLGAGREVPEWDDMVAEYAEQLLQEHPEGVFNLAGWSLGGNLAMDVAARLEQRGRQVAFVGWIDAPAPVRVEAFWNEIGPTPEAVPNLSVGEMRVELLGVMFPERAEHIERAWSSICSATTDDEQRWTRMSDWAEAEIGAEFATLRSEIAQSNELEVSWELKQILDERLKAMDYPRLTAKVSLWWAARSTNAIQRSAVERSMAEAIGAERVEPVRVLDTRHDKIIDHPEFVQSFRAALERAGR
ncbi:TPA: pyoverdine non-ribosomal peptide synthetase PvdD [Pseudomonas aeruginosa]|uniref:pyoverdine non-ribosomal peptide synthetase PvdD n=1 Tax=Pseudomonas aeruginosa TaxID=287 RepID=UPI00053ED448|nr:pyoverdine non-ribosomal peptide synthetase PvdD [Pseudomonas aeruginosa]EIU1614391.1 pyoverdine non-ribosomal peptide synthetase PvdD [Pseudomonas aeruginosa]EIU1620531.1 pyoverdine non-ribosomal peptide synthetase PvdD [Pseudomonas aeruginosa]EKU1146790.1 pyoverdine non-ribosomal peptide synthetase PvdD [Pseudomonas aeruginosa]EKU1918579.1 pyoverdine non-ribosomal peptide synthetase PvdD [Pseudomonas aeruginosa]EKU1973439.1 pyoverdine non-ribosomal peptide synthetase PvdD [Pseudomonas aer